MQILRIVALVLVLAGVGGHARADDPPGAEALAAAQELLAVLSPDMMKQLTGSITASFWPVVEQKARAEKIDEATIGELRAEFERIQVAFVTDAMKEAPPIYARHFTVAELHELTAFYRTPTGAKALHEIPQVMGEMTALLVPRLQEVQRQTSEAFGEILREHGYGTNGSGHRPPARLYCGYRRNRRSPAGYALQ
jgi:uncharacterized protein